MYWAVTPPQVSILLDAKMLVMQLLWGIDAIVHMYTQNPLSHLNKHSRFKQDLCISLCWEEKKATYEELLISLGRRRQLQQKE